VPVDHQLILPFLGRRHSKNIEMIDNKVVPTAGVNDHPYSGWLGFTLKAERQKHERASIVAFVTARKARSLNCNSERILCPAKAGPQG
jgi:hypothetical protein